MCSLCGTCLWFLQSTEMQTNTCSGQFDRRQWRGMANIVKTATGNHFENYPGCCPLTLLQPPSQMARKQLDNLSACCKAREMQGSLVLNVFVSKTPDTSRGKEHRRIPIVGSMPESTMGVGRDRSKCLGSRQTLVHMQPVDIKSPNRGSRTWPKKATYCRNAQSRP